MIITKTNVLKNKVPTVFIGVSTDQPANVIDPDFSTSYTSTDPNRLTFDFGATSTINYVAFAGTNIKGNGDFTSRFRVRDGSTIVATNFIERDNCVVVTFEPQSFSNLRVGMYNAAGSTPPQVHYIAGGEYFEVPNGGEQAGYNRQFLRRNITNKTTINNLAAPISTLQKRKEAKGNLNLPNMTKAFSEGEWQDFLDFAYTDNVFFIKEQVESPLTATENNSSAYLCFTPSNDKVIAHAQTRELNNCSISFKVFNGL